MRRQKYFRFLESGFAVFLLASVFFALIALSTPVFAENLASTSASEVLQLKLDHLKETQKNDVDTLKEAQKNSLDTVNKRIDDALTMNAQASDRFGLIVTILLGLFGLVGYFTVAHKAKTEAQEAAENWFKDNAQALEAEIEALRAKVVQASDSIDETVKGVSDHGEAVISAMNRKQLDIEQRNSGHPSSSTHSDDKDDEIIRLRDQELQQQPESTYSFDDWNARAHAAYASNNLIDAVYFWGRASQVEGAGAVEIAKALFNKGVAQGQMGDHEGAIASFDEVIGCYGERSEVSLQVWVVRALFGKAHLQGQADKHEDALASYEKVINRYGDASEIFLQEVVAAARLNRGARKARMDDYAGAIASFDKVIRLYSKMPEVTFREQVANALFNKGVVQSKMGDNTGAIASYNEVIRCYGEASEPVLQGRVAIALVNKGDEQDKMGDLAGAMVSYDEAIRRYNDAPKAVLWEVAAKALAQKERLANHSRA